MQQGRQLKQNAERQHAECNGRGGEHGSSGDKGRAGEAKKHVPRDARGAEDKFNFRKISLNN